MYFDYRQSKDNWMLPRDVVIRTGFDPASLASAVRTAVWSVDPSQPVSHVLTLDQVLDEEVADRRVEAMLLGTLAALALILACVGIYGVMTYTVTQRTQEIGVRVALGANASSVFRTVAGHGLLLTGLGIAIGVGASLALSQLLASLLFGVNATDPLTYAVATGLFVLVALIACLLPARRAAKVDPVIALRYE
jgi:putative ABC transport system permease protein